VIGELIWSFFRATVSLCAAKVNLNCVLDVMDLSPSVNVIVTGKEHAVALQLY
jgi:hypothetical protein